MFSLIGSVCALEFRLEQESGIFFNMKYFEEKALAGEWDDVEKYILGFTKMDDNSFSMKIFFQIRKQKYLEALDRYVLLLLLCMGFQLWSFGLVSSCLSECSLFLSFPFNS